MLKPAFGKQRLDFLDALRGGAALVVLLEHGLHAYFPTYLQFTKDYILLGQSAILIFFMISGFVIPLSLEGGRSSSKFWLRRSFRLFPVYWCSIALAFGYLALGGSIDIGVALADTKTWLSNIVLVQGIVQRPNVWGVFWSLHLELALYVTFTALFSTGLLQRMGTKSFAGLFLVFALGFAGSPLLTGKPPGNGDLRLVILAALFGLVANRYVAGRISRRAFYGLAAAFLGVVAVMWIASRLMFPELVTTWHFLRCAILVALACSLFAFALENRAWTLPKFAGWLGRRSYPIYLVHPFVLVLLAPLDWPWGAALPVIFGATLLFADVIHRLVENPGVALGKWLEGSRKLAPATLPFPADVRRAA